MQIDARKDISVAAEVHLVYKATARTNSWKSCEESQKGRKSLQARPRTSCCTGWNKTNRATQTQQCTWVKTSFRRKDRPKLGVEHLVLSESDSDHASQRAGYETDKDDKALQVIRLGIDWNKEALDVPTFTLANTSSRHYDQVVCNVLKWTTRLLAQMRASILDSFDTISIVSFLPYFKQKCDMNGICESAAMWLLFSHLEARRPHDVLKDRSEIQIIA